MELDLIAVLSRRAAEIFRTSSLELVSLSIESAQWYECIITSAFFCQMQEIVRKIRHRRILTSCRQVICPVPSLQQAQYAITFVIGCMEPREVNGFLWESSLMEVMEFLKA